ncbi:ParB/RepB/Spo0J family partition protein [Paenibacillus protaetiae]|uniref:ParB/RepB/Spo0J family partition protein n=1 Tax=Paenibacillus protaetiae TaxID=2509456 RepID=A0A4P6ETJ8_9BACL|nr:ParB/RepB/Spo0J family partition protein [Paenibacillus protaetiae]QAY65966.1 ParB/RepB/Spo0J family partition protein [Paenibacillus protaetiae]
MDIVQIPVHLIDEDTDQPRYRFGEESLQELISSIEELGLLSPIKVRTLENGRYKIIYGNRRYKATMALKRETIPCIVSNATDETEIYLEQIAENLTREGFTPIEEAEAFDKLLHNPKFNSSVKFLASKFGKPESYIKNKCELLKFGSPVKKLVVSGTEIRANQLTEEQLLPLKDLPIEYRDTLALTMAKDEMPVSDVKKIAKLFKDKDISDSTKSKLLFKSGPGLLETWSTHRLNKAEREAKAAQKQAAAEAQAAAAGSLNSRTGDADAAAPLEAPALSAAQAAAAGSLNSRAGDADAAAPLEAPALSAAQAAAAGFAGLERSAQLLQQALDACAAAMDASALHSLAGDERAGLLARSEQLLELLEQNSQMWRAIQGAVQTASAAQN